MSEYRIAYNPFTFDYIAGNQSHTIQLYNKGKQKFFDDYIRGIIINNTLYLRLYYPFNDIDVISKDKLYQSSYTLLKDNTKNVINAIKKHDNLVIIDVKYNVDNNILRELKLTNI